MTGKIEVYVKNAEVVVSQSIMRPIPDHTCTDGMLTRTEKVMSESDQAAIKIAKEIAGEKGLSVDIYNIRNARGRIMAKLRHVKTTPTIIIGHSRIEGKLTPNQLKSKLQSCTAE